MKKLFLCLFLLASSAFADDVQTLPHLHLGLKKPHNWQELGRFVSGAEFPVAVADLPKHFDMRDEVAGGLPKVKRQQWNDCWAQGSTAVVELNAAAQFNDFTMLSVQQNISCSGRGTARSGGYFTHAYQKSFGQADEAQFPYVGKDVRCKSGLKPVYKVTDWGYVGARGRRPTYEEVKQAIHTYGAVGITIAANGALSSFRNTTKDAVFKGCSRGPTNHIETVVGWDDATKALLVRNSWGESHGYQGYAWIPYGCSQAGSEIVTWVQIEKL
jgi:C1A family cysteine protease